MSLQRSCFGARSLAPAALAALFACGGCGGQPVDAQPTEAAHAPAPPPRAGPAPDFATATQAAETDPVARLGEQVAALRREVAELRRRLPAGVVAAAAATPADPRRDPQSRERMQQDERGRVAAAEAAFRGEAMDASWSAETAGRIRGALASVQAPDAVAVHSLECRSRTCRLEFGADDGPASQRELPRTLARLAGIVSRATAGRVELGAGREATVLYLSN